MLSTAGTYAATRCRGKKAGNGDFKSKKNTSLKKRTESNSSNSEIPSMIPSNSSLETFDSAKQRTQMNKFYKPRNTSSDIMDYNRNLPDYLANLKPGEIDCPCLLHCQRKSNEYASGSLLSTERTENITVPRVTINRLSLDSRLMSSTPRIFDIGNIRDIRKGSFDETRLSTSNIYTRSRSNSTPPVAENVEKQFTSVGVQTESYKGDASEELWCCFLPSRWGRKGSRWGRKGKRKRIPETELSSI